MGGKAERAVAAQFGIRGFFAKFLENPPEHVLLNT
jgi:hypothetical protein